MRRAAALVAAAERAPYGKGPDTRVDTTVRDCWQSDAARVKIAGGAWPKTFARILAAAGAGLGCPVERLDARLYKLLIYRTRRVLCGAPRHREGRRHGRDARIGEEYVDSWAVDDTDVGDMEIGEVFDSSHWIDGWVAPNGDRPPLGEVPLLPGELLPRDALDDADPDEQEMHEV